LAIKQFGNWTIGVKIIEPEFLWPFIYIFALLSATFKTNSLPKKKENKEQWWAYRNFCFDFHLKFVLRVEMQQQRERERDGWGKCWKSSRGKGEWKWIGKGHRKSKCQSSEARRFFYLFVAAAVICHHCCRVGSPDRGGNAANLHPCLWFDFPFSISSTPSGFPCSDRCRFPRPLSRRLCLCKIINLRAVNSYCSASPVFTSTQKATTQQI